jgi:4a-hydroxytetrahydrobiopterin dehydratase
MNAAAIQARLAHLPAWQLNEAGTAISREFTLAGFTEATQFIARLAAPANAMDHHPDVQLYRYKRVKITLTTHSTGGLTENDFNLAAKIDALV